MSTQSPPPKTLPKTSPPPLLPLLVRIYYEDTDVGGVVYHAAYVRFFERARTECLRQLECNKPLFVVRSLALEYLRPVFLDDILEVDAVPKARGHAYVDFAQTAIRDGDVVAKATVRVVCVSGMPPRVRALPPPLADIISRYVG